MSNKIKNALQRASDAARLRIAEQVKHDLPGLEKRICEHLERGEFCFRIHRGTQGTRGPDFPLGDPTQQRLYLQLLREKMCYSAFDRLEIAQDDGYNMPHYIRFVFALAAESAEFELVA